MSYILDALKRAESERRQGQGVDAEAPAAPTWVEDDDDESPRRRGPLLTWLAGGLLLGLIGAVAWRGWMDQRPAEAPVAPRTVAAAPTTPEVLPTPATQPKPEPTPAASPAPVAATPPAPVVPMATPPVAPPVAPPVKPVAAVAPAAGREARAPKVGAPMARQDLPAEVQAQLPPFKLSGSIHSSRAADRLLVIDGQVAHEGDQVTPELVLERIQPKSAVFRFKSYRFEVVY